MRRRPRDAGSVAVEAALLAPVLLSFVLMAVVAGRIQATGAVIDEAARAGARAASLSRSPDVSRQRAARAVAEVLNERGVRCTEPASSEAKFDDRGPIPTPGGQLDTWTVSVSCNVSLDYLLLPGTPGNKHMTSEFTSVVDRYRGTG